MWTLCNFPLFLFPPLPPYNSFLSLIDFSMFELSFAPELHGYGSFMNGFGTAGSDIDSMICTQSFIDERQILSYIQLSYKVANIDRGVWEIISEFYGFLFLVLSETARFEIATIYFER
jgi:hypothetical protein